MQATTAQTIQAISAAVTAGSALLAALVYVRRTMRASRGSRAEERQEAALRKLAPGVMEVRRVIDFVMGIFALPPNHPDNNPTNKAHNLFGLVGELLKLYRQWDEIAMDVLSRRVRKSYYRFEAEWDRIAGTLVRNPDNTYRTLDEAAFLAALPRALKALEKVDSALVKAGRIGE